MTHIEEFRELVSAVKNSDSVDFCKLDRMQELYNYACATAAESERAANAASNEASRYRWPGTTGS